MPTTRLSPNQLLNMRSLLGDHRNANTNGIRTTIRMSQINFDNYNPYEVYEFLRNIFKKNNIRVINTRQISP